MGDGLNKQIGSGPNIGQIIGAAGAGVGAMRQRKSQMAAYEMMASRFDALGADGQKVAQFIREDPAAAHMYARQFGGWEKFVPLMEAKYHRAELGRQMGHAQASGNWVTPAEAGSIGREAYVRGEDPRQAIIAARGAQPDYGAVFRGMSPNVHDPVSIVKGYQHLESTGDVTGAAEMIEPLDKGGYQTGAPKLAKLFTLEDYLLKEEKLPENHKRVQQVRRAIENEIKGGRGGGALTMDQARKNNEIDLARWYISKWLDEQLAADKKPTRRQLFGKVDLFADWFNPADPLLAKHINMAWKVKNGESAETAKAWQARFAALPVTAEGGVEDYSPEAAGGQAVKAPAAAPVVPPRPPGLPLPSDIDNAAALDKELGWGQPGGR